LHSTPNTSWVITLTRMRLERQVIHRGKRIGAYKVWWGNLTESDHLEDFCVDIRITYTECPTRNGQNFGRVFLMLNYTDITQN